ncbi:leucine-rich repeat receptor protein kinase HPCA1-like isoform X2 [Prosopis cineraria]|uniref:leucine-rich repeat receptor protein kinase HPCA1-like isoform X2 n=1 Tax=Prosopis cineraria TaxID=364024 RepID=UPI00240FA778|nr:leucine-rich repeat receptor protein kinase HPCA1-like isoform X2 [Prosopis cineraria]
MGERMAHELLSLLLLLLILLNYLLLSFAESPTTAKEDVNALNSLKNLMQKVPQSWESSDPCNGWEGITCTQSRITSIKLAGMELNGQISADFGLLSELKTLDLSYNKNLEGPFPKAIGNLKKLEELFLVGCGFTGPIPDEIGSLRELVFLSINSNSFSGRIPASIGNLSKLEWLDLSDNQLVGPIPVSSGATSGLDMLLNTLHFHLGNNNLSGAIPPELFSSNMALIHLILNDNKLTGSIPKTLGRAQNLTVVRLENNFLTGFVPENLTNLRNVTDLDMSNNNFEPSEFPSWLQNLQFLKSLIMENTNLRGKIPAAFFSLANLRTVVLKDNELGGSLDIGTNYSKQLKLIDLQNNSIEDFNKQDEASGITIILVDNAACYETGSETSTLCTIQNKPPAESPKNCVPDRCSVPNQISSPNCKCAQPYEGTLSYKAPSYMTNETYVEEYLLETFRSHHLPVDSVSVITPTCFPFHCFKSLIRIFPSDQDHFNQTMISAISLLLSNLTTIQAYSFVLGPNDYGNGLESSRKSSNASIIIGAAVGGSVLLALFLLAGVYAFCQTIRAEKAIEESDPFGHWDACDSSGARPQLHGARRFSLKELQEYTNNFSQANEIGSGGYGKVSRGTLPNGQLVAIKRAQKQSNQGALQFKSEIELLSRVHHKNLVSLVGFCFERGEQILVYEFVPNGTLKDSISGKSGIVLDWTRRLKVALGSARGLVYLHEHANPPVIHRDIKSTNILLDEHSNARVADFGLSKPVDNCEKDHVTTQVKGTMGYLDPDYCTTQQLTEKSDVYSYGVVLLELLTARKPIQAGKHIVKVFRSTIDKTKRLYGLHEILDPALDLGSPLKGLENFVDLAMKCVEDSGADRPTMSDVVKEIEHLLKSAGLNSTAESSASNSATFEELSNATSQVFSTALSLRIQVHSTTSERLSTRAQANWWLRLDSAVMVNLIRGGGQRISKCKINGEDIQDLRKSNCHV